MRPRRRVWWFVALLVVATGGSVAAAAAGPGVGGAAPATDDSVVAPVDPPLAPVAGATADRTIDLHQALRLTPDRPGEYDARHRYRVPDGVVRLSVRLPAGATVVDSSDFVHDGGDTYAWDRSTSRPSLTYRVPANRTVDRDDPIGAPGRYMFADVGEWGLVLRPQVAHDWGWTGGGQVRLDRQVAVDGEGAVGEAMVFLGPHETYTREAHGQTFRLVVPAAATLAEEPEEILRSLADASDALRVGARHREVFVVAAPTGGVDWGVRGAQTGRADLWVADAERLDVADNVWLHEYVHARQTYSAADDLRWFTEGSAVYYAALLSLEQERIGFDAFRDRLARGTRDQFDAVRLAEPGTWRGYPDYHVGALVAGELDRQLRLASGSERSLQDAVRRLNEEPGTVDARRFEALLRADGGDAVAESSAHYTGTTSRPVPWDATAHAEAFGVPLPRIATTVRPSYGVDGPYRSGALADPVEVVPEETLSVVVRVDNEGDRGGDFDVGFRVDGTERDRRSGRLGPGDSTELSFDHTFEGVGDRVVAVGETTIPVRVSAPARAAVTGFSADRTAVDPGETVALTIVVENGADRPGRIELPVTHDGEVVAREDVRLGPGERRSVTVERTLTRRGEHTFGLGDADGRRVVVTVARGPIWRESPGFGAAAALLAVLLLGLGGARRS